MIISRLCSQNTHLSSRAHSMIRECSSHLAAAAAPQAESGKRSHPPLTTYCSGISPLTTRSGSAKILYAMVEMNSLWFVLGAADHGGTVLDSDCVV